MVSQKRLLTSFAPWATMSRSSRGMAEVCSAEDKLSDGTLTLSRIVVSGAQAVTLEPMATPFLGCRKLFQILLYYERCHIFPLFSLLTPQYYSALFISSSSFSRLVLVFLGKWSRV
jgi:hypothetical protein